MASLGNTTPNSGGRLHAVLADSVTEGARYEITLTAAGGRWQGHALVSPTGDVTLELQSPTAPQWLLDLAASVLRTACRGRTPQDLPRRITRWRPAPDER